MPDLTVWIEAQLKRGYTREQVKRYLAAKGYSSTIAAKVDKMKTSNLSMRRKRAIGTPKSMPKGLASILPVVAVGVVAVLLLFLTDSLTSSEQQEKAGEKPVTVETAGQAAAQAASPPPYPQLPEEILAAICNRYENLPADAVPCRAAYDYFAKNYDGTLTRFGLVLDTGSSYEEFFPDELTVGNEAPTEPVDASRLRWYGRFDTNRTTTVPGTNYTTTISTVVLDARDLSLVTVTP